MHELLLQAATWISQFVALKEHDTIEYMVFDFICIKFKYRQN